jgi:CHAD domain-containing protein
MSAPPALRPGHAVGEALQAVAAHSLAQARAALSPDVKDSATAIHDFRKAMKRWRALLRLLGPLVGPQAEELRQDARAMAHGLTSARDAQSALEALEDSEPLAEWLSARSAATVRARLEALRAAGEQVSWDEPVRKALVARIDAAEQAVSRWSLDHVTFADVAERLAATYRRARRAIPEDWAAATDEELHELRRRVIEHRYQMELVEPSWPRLGHIWVDEAQKLRNRLGSHQDLAVLGRLCGPHQPLARWRSRLAPMIAEKQTHLVKSAARVAARLFAEPPKAFRRRMEALWEAQGGDE